MDLNNPSFKICEETLDTIFHFTASQSFVDKKLVINTLSKSVNYVSNALRFLQLLKLIQIADDKIQLLVTHDSQSSALYTASVIKKRLTEFPPFMEYCKLLQSGKNEKQALKLVKATHSITNDIDAVKKCFDNWFKYLEKDIVVRDTSNKVQLVPNSNDLFWIDEKGHLIYDHEKHTKQIISRIESSQFKNPLFIDQQRIESLKQINTSTYDLAKLIRILEEINDAYRIENYYSVGALLRAVLDHIPPIFSKRSFIEVANNYGSKSFRDTMQNLENFSRKIADGFLHTQIRRKESLPNKTTVDCKNAVDILLGEIVNELTPHVDVSKVKGQ